LEYIGALSTPRTVLLAKKIASLTHSPYVKYLGLLAFNFHGLQSRGTNAQVALNINGELIRLQSFRQYSLFLSLLNLGVSSRIARTPPATANSTSESKHNFLFPSFDLSYYFSLSCG
jgi:hypothetical protein